MSRLLRWAFNVAAAVSAILFVVMAALWVRSYWAGDSLIWSDGAFLPTRVYQMGHRYVATSAGGRIYLMHDTSWWFEPQLRYQRFDDIAYDISALTWGDPGYRSAFGFRWATVVGTPFLANVPVTPFVMYRVVAIPFWFLTSGFSAIPILLVKRKIRRRLRRSTGYCPVCDYDLRASPDRCPECGTANQMGGAIAGPGPAL